MRAVVLFFTCLFSFFELGAQSVQIANLDEAVLSTSDRTYVSFSQGLGNYKTPYGLRKLNPLIFEGQISPDFFLTLSKRREVGLAFFPKVVVRMYNQNSVPVKTPSYMPSLLFYHRVNWPFTKKVFDFFTKEEQLVFMTYRLIHHSNGQEGEYLIPGSDSINYKNGNFSTNSFETAFSWSAIDSGAVGRAVVNGRLAYERQFDFQRESQIKDRYYYNKLRLETHIIYSEKIKAYITYSFMWGTRHFGTRQSFDLLLSMKPVSKLADFSVFVRAYMGPDYYNLYYENSMRAVTVGIIADPLRIPIFKRSKKKPV